jgi:hypothetical protein
MDVCSLINGGCTKSNSKGTEFIFLWQQGKENFHFLPLNENTLNGNLVCHFSNTTLSGGLISGQTTCTLYGAHGLKPFALCGILILVR